MIQLGAREHHRFEAAGKPFVYLVPSAAIFALDETADDVLRRLTEGPRTREELVSELSARHAQDELEDTISELARVRAIGELVAPAVDPRPLRQPRQHRVGGLVEREDRRARHEVDERLARGLEPMMFPRPQLDHCPLPP